MPENWQAVVLWPEHWEQIRNALIAYAAMVERCEMARSKIAKHNRVFREVWGHDDVFDGNKMLDYILRGYAGKEERWRVRARL